MRNIPSERMIHVYKTKSLQNNLLYSLVSFILLLLGTWGFRALAQELYYGLHLMLLVWCAMTLAIVIGFTIVAATFAFLHESTNSYLPLLIGLGAILLAFQFPLQLQPEIRHFLQHRDKYETVVQLLQSGVIQNSQVIPDYKSSCYAMRYEIDGIEFCFATEQNNLENIIFYLDSPFYAVIYSERGETQFACDPVEAYFGVHWWLCRLPVR